MVVLTALITATVVLVALICTAIAAYTEYIQYASESATAGTTAVATYAGLAAEVARDDGRRVGLIYNRRNRIADGYNRGLARIVCYA